MKFWGAQDFNKKLVFSAVCFVPLYDSGICTTRFNAKWSKRSHTERVGFVLSTEETMVTLKTIGLCNKYSSCLLAGNSMAFSPQANYTD
jgi:hypothetical protein